MLAACGGSPPPETKSAAPKAAPAAAPDPPRITQFYATVKSLVKGQQTLLCYGVENTRQVWLDPPRRELSNAQTRCVEASPAETTTYTLSAKGDSGPPVTQQLTVTVTLPVPRTKLVSVTFTSLDLK